MFLDRYFPYTPPPGQPMANAQQDAQEVAGHYLSSRRSQGTVISFINLVSQEKVTPNRDGTISISSARELSGEPKHFQEIGPLLYREMHGQDRFAFDRDHSGRLVMSMDFPFMVAQASPLHVSLALNLTILIFCLVVFLVILLGWPIAAIARRHYGHSLDLPPQDRKLRLWVHIACIVEILFAIGWIAIVMSMSSGLPSAQLDVWVRVCQVIGWLGIIGAIVIIYAAIRFLRDPLSAWFKTYNVVAAIACIAFVWFMFNWHLLRFSLQY